MRAVRFTLDGPVVRASRPPRGGGTTISSLVTLLGFGLVSDVSTRWRSTSGAMLFTSSGVTKARPRGRRGRATPGARAIVARGLAPNSISGTRSASANLGGIARGVHEVHDVVDDALVHVQLADATDGRRAVCSRRRDGRDRDARSPPAMRAGSPSPRRATGSRLEASA